MSAAACTTSHRSPVAPQRRRGSAAAWQAPSPARHAGAGREAHEPSSAPPSRWLTLRTHASHRTATAELAQYQFTQRRSATSPEWFQSAIRDIVKHVDQQTPFLQTVQLGSDGAAPRFESYGVNESVVAAPELWQGIAEHVAHSSPDVVILVQRVNPHAAGGSPQGAMDAADAREKQQQQQQRAASDAAASSGSSSSPPGSPRSPTVAAEEACRRLVNYGLADAILVHGQVGDCCDGSAAHTDGDGAATASGGSGVEARQPPARPLPLPAIVPFAVGSAGGARRAAVRAAALRPAGQPGLAAPAASCQQAACFWGVVVQSRRHTGAEGCYLLKTVRNVGPDASCSCTHFSLTRISAGEHLEQQFVQSWLL